MTAPEQPTGWATVNIHAGPIRLTGHQSVMAGHQIAMGYRVNLNMQPDIAAQWIEVLQQIAPTKESN